MAEQKHVHKHQYDNPDSIEIGTPSKGGAVKVYGDFSHPYDFIDKIDNAAAVRAHAQAILGGGQ